MRLPAGGGAEDAGGLFWVLDEEVQVEGSSDSVVLERLCAAFEKKGPGAEGKGMSWGRVRSPARELESDLDEACTGWDLSAEMSACGPACAFIHSCVHSFRYPSHVWSSYRMLGAMLYSGKPASCGPQFWLRSLRE